VPCIELPKHGEQPLHVVRGAMVHDVEILRRRRCTMQDRCDTANYDELDAAVDECREQRFDVSLPWV
jgi:hypothetical protein